MTSNLPPIRPQRPRPGEPIGPGLALWMWLDSIPCVRSGYETPLNAPLTPEEIERYEAYMRDQNRPASFRL